MIEEKRLDVLLDLWAEWMHRDSWVDGWPSQVPLLRGGYNSAQAFDEMADAAEQQLAEHVNACIDGLTLNQRAAIESRYLASVWRFPRLVMAEVLQEARAALLVALERRGVQ